MIWKYISAVAVLVSLVEPAAATGWKTSVTDIGDGDRAVSLVGSDSAANNRGILVNCGGPTTAALPAMPATLDFVTPPSRAYSVRVGDAASLKLGSAGAEGAVLRNDSAGMTVEAELPKLEPFLAELDHADPVVVTLAATEYSDRMMIPADGLATALEEFRAACVPKTSAGK